jgi:cytochrome c556
LATVIASARVPARKCALAQPLRADWRARLNESAVVPVVRTRDSPKMRQLAGFGRSPRTVLDFHGPTIACSIPRSNQFLARQRSPIVSIHRQLRWSSIAFIVGGTIMIGSSVDGQDALSVFMKAKLEHSQKTLEGLAKADYDLVAKHSQAISLLCEDELWAVLKTPEYYERSKEFQRSVNTITEAARKHNLEAATLAYVDTTLKCVSCHKYVRQTRKP